MREIKVIAIQTGRPSVGLDQLHVGQATLGDAALREADHARLAVRPDDLAGRSDPAGEQFQHTKRAAAEVNGAPSCRYLKAIQQSFSLSPVNLPLRQKARPLTLV